VNAEGRMVVGNMREAVQSLDTEEQQRHRIMQRAIQGFMFKTCETSYGDTNLL
jgi:hypothetical protein